MRAIDADALYERACELEAQALAYVGKIINDETKVEEWKTWSAILTERTAFKHDIYDAPTIEPERKTGRWIPVSERLPEVGKDVMVCYDFKGYRSVLIGVLYGDEKFHGYDDEYLTPEGRKYRKAVAWMPLPEPYREGEG